MSRVGSALGLAPDGIAASVVSVEAHVARGLPSLGIVGLPGASVGEARWRVRSAFDSAGLRWPEGRLVVGLSPADLPKDGTGLDLAMAIALLVADGQVPAVPATMAFAGELGLDGTVRHVRHALAIASGAAAAGLGTVVVPVDDAGAAALVPGIEAVGVRSLAHCAAVLRGEEPPVRPAGAGRSHRAGGAPDLADVRGQPMARLAVEVAAAGGHHLALTGTPGSGKTMLAQRLHGILPPLDGSDALAVATIRAVTGEEPLADRPCVAPHHSASPAAVLGSVSARGVRPGAVTRAHLGVLLLDEAPEFARPALEGLRQPLEEGEVRLMRVDRITTLPARFQLALTANPCPCGHGDGRGERCACTAQARRRYAERLSGPLLDRVDLRIAAAKPSRGELRAGPGEPSSVVAERVLAARERASARLAGTPWRVNAHVPAGPLRAGLPEDAAGLLDRFAEREPGLRGIDRMLRVAWTLADLAGLDRPGADEVAMAAALRGGTAP